MVCWMCVREKLTKRYRIGQKVYNLCSECIQELEYKYIEICPNCGGVAIVYTDKRNTNPTAINCLCWRCMPNDKTIQETT